MFKLLDRLQTKISGVLKENKNPLERRIHIVENSLHGADIKEWALQITYLRLFLQVTRGCNKISNKLNTNQSLRTNLKRVDSLLEKDKNFYHIVICNPPYVRHENISDPIKSKSTEASSEQKYYKNSLTDLFRQELSAREKDYKQGPPLQLSAKSDLYVYFFIRCAGLLTPQGTCCILTSNSWLDVKYGHTLKYFLLRYYRLSMLIDNSQHRSFSSARINTVITLFSQLSTSSRKNSELTRFVRLTAPYRAALSAKIFDTIESAQKPQETDIFQIVPLRQQQLLANGTTSSKIAQTFFDKWGGIYLRGKSILHRIIAAAGSRLTTLGSLGKVRYPLKTGINPFFYLSLERAKKFQIEPQFLTQIVKSPQEFTSLRLKRSKLGTFLFQCQYSKETLRKKGYTGCLNYILWGESQKTSARQKSKAGVPWPKVPSVKNRRYWYSIQAIPPADLICNRFFNKRLFFGFSDFDVVEDQTFYGCTFFEEVKKLFKPQAALLNSAVSLLFTELCGRVALGEGVLQYAKYEMEQLPVLDARTFSEETCRQLTRVFDQIADTPLKNIPDQLETQGQQQLDRLVFDALKLSQQECNEVYYSIKRGPDILFDNTLILLNNKMDICGCSKTQFPLINSRIGNVHLKTVSGSR